MGQTDSGTAPCCSRKLCSHQKTECGSKIGALAAISAPTRRTEIETGKRRNQQETCCKPAADQEQEQDRTSDQVGCKANAANAGHAAVAESSGNPPRAATRRKI